MTDKTAKEPPRPAGPGSPPRNGPGEGAIPGIQTREGRQFFRDWEVVRQFPTQGGEADVFLVRGKDGQRILKIFRFGITPKPEVFQRLIVLGESHPDSFVRIFQFELDETSGCWFELEEFISEGSLADLIGRRPFAESETTGLVRTLARAVSLLHDHQVLHLDLKPANVLVRTRQPLAAVLSDFSISSDFDAALSKKITVYKGTSLYQSPENIAGVVVPKSDWWSLGIMVLELLLGKHPLEGLQPQVILYQLTTQGIEIPTDLPPRWRELLMGLLTRNPEKRWGGAEVHRWLAGESPPTFYQEEAAPARVPADGEASFTVRSTFRQYEKPFLLAGRNLHSLEEVFETAFSSPEAWEEARARISRGDLEAWLEGNGDPARAAQLHERAEQEPDADLLLLTAGCFVHPAIPFAWRGSPCRDEALIESLSRFDALSRGEQELVEGLFSGNLHRQYRKLTGRSLGKIDKLLKIAEGISASGLRELPLAMRAKLLLHLYRNDFAGERALPLARAALAQDPAADEVFVCLRAKGFAEFAKQTSLWTGDDRALWDLAGQIPDSPWKADPQVLELLLLHEDQVTAAARKDPGLRKFLARFLARPDPDHAYIKDLQDLLRVHDWLEPVIRAAYLFPEDRSLEECLGSLRTIALVRFRADSLQGLVFPPVLEQCRAGEFIDQPAQRLVREILDHPEVLIRKSAFISSWKDIRHFGRFISFDLGEISTLDQMKALKFEVHEILDCSKILVAAELVLYSYLLFVISGGLFPQAHRVPTPVTLLSLVALLLCLIFLGFHLLEKVPWVRRILRATHSGKGPEPSWVDSPNFGSPLNIAGMVLVPALFLIGLLIGWRTG